MSENIFDLPDNLIYLNSAGQGARLHAVNDAARSALASSARPWEGDMADWFGAVEHLRELAAATFGTEAEALAYVPSASYGMAVAARNLPLAEGDTVVLLAGEYPSNRSVWQVAAEATGARCIEVRPEAGESWTDAVLRGIDPHTKVVSAPPCFWCDGAPLDLFAIRERAHAQGAALVVDASQALGAVSMDLDALGADFVVCVGHKWLLGAHGLGWLWAAPRWRAQGEPIEQTWLARELRGDFNAIAQRLPPYRPGAARFDAGSSAHPLLTPIATAAMQQLHDWRIAEVEAALGALTTHLHARMEAAGMGALMPNGHLPHLCAIRPPAEHLQAAANALREAGVVLSIRDGALRVAPHRHVTTQQLDRVVEVLTAVL
ncbi:aminotransferase class V-fold PLP-dependent enzyme [Algiphilus aromaticivorans]|uniref:aminotransferase class V-fold PLP-dependent enzyme n=1 Tax=Algiphilus aromaticivorans TaxID=382454 RepID=UPI000693DDAE|nr:aminotransferase class V-fold PLP-dependent enzyme [Algiphilus aromaticivorans]